MIAQLTRKEKLLVYGMASATLFGFGYVGGQRLKAPSEIKFEPVPVHNKVVTEATQLIEPTAVSNDPAAKEPPARKGKKVAPPLGSVNLNTATSSELQQIPGIGKSTAASILGLREKKGRIGDVNELREIRGMNGKRFDQIRPYLNATNP